MIDGPEFNSAADVPLSEIEKVCVAITGGAVTARGDRDVWIVSDWARVWAWKGEPDLDEPAMWGDVLPLGPGPVGVRATFLRFVELLRAARPEWDVYYEDEDLALADARDASGWLRPDASPPPAG